MLPFPVTVTFPLQWGEMDALGRQQHPLLRVVRVGEGHCSNLLLSYISEVRFEWNPKKATANLRKHGVSFEEAETAFGDPLAAYYPDTLHEARFVLIGRSERHRLLYVVHAEVTIDTIRIISARKATRNEKAHYEND